MPHCETIFYRLDENKKKLLETQSWREEDGGL